MLTTEKFIQSWGESKIFYLTSYIRDYKTTGTFWKKWLAFIILLTMVAGATLGQFITSPKEISFDMFYFSAIAAANQLGVDPKPFFVAIAVAASASFATPIGYQTNLLVQAIGNYKFRDCLKIGIPLNILVFIISVLLIPFFWSF